MGKLFTARAFIGVIAGLEILPSELLEVPTRNEICFLLVPRGRRDAGVCVTVLSPDPESDISIWETSSRLENRECNFIGVVETDSDYYGFLIEHGVCSNDISFADHDSGYQIGDAGYPDFFDFLTKVGLNVWDDEEEIEQEDEEEAND
jgi:hypothetical protein